MNSLRTVKWLDVFTLVIISKPVVLWLAFMTNVQMIRVLEDTRKYEFLIITNTKTLPIHKN